MTPPAPTRRRPDRTPRRRGHALLLPALLGALAAACAPTQRYPSPMKTADPLPESNGAWFEPGLLEVEVWRHADPVRIRRAGSAGAFPMSYLRKTERVSSGSVVLTAPGGRAEVVWPAGDTLIRLFDTGSLVVTDPGRDEPTAVLLTLTRAELRIGPGDVVMLPGGATVRGDDEEPSGPFHVESRRRDEIVRLENRSKHVAEVRYREQTLVVFPCELVDLPLLPGGTAPRETSPGETRHQAGPITVTTLGDADTRPLGPAVEVRATTASRARALGVDVWLAPGHVATFRPLGTERAGEAGGPPAAEPPAAEPPAGETLPLAPAPADGGEPGAGDIVEEEPPVAPDGEPR